MAQIAIGAVLVLFLSRVLIKPLDGYSKLIVATLCAQFFGYLMVWSNTKIIKLTDILVGLRELNPNKIGYLIMPLGSIAIGVGYYSKNSIFIFIGGCLFFAANYLLTRIKESLFLKMMREADRKDEEMRVKDLAVTILGEKSDERSYEIIVTNTGKRLFKKLRVRYDPILLHAESFGMDTTHMPMEDAYSFDDPILIEVLSPGQSVQFVRNGWGSQEDFDGMKTFPIQLDFEIDGELTNCEDKKWCDVKVKLPNARR